MFSDKTVHFLKTWLAFLTDIAILGGTLGLPALLIASLLQVGVGITEEKLYSNLLSLWK